MEGLRSPIRMVLEGLEGIVLLVLAVLTWPLSRLFLTNLGARPDERERGWPGDRLLTRTDVRATRAITIRAPAAAVWPWLVQFGLDRGGFHSYELLERLGGINVRNVERISPDTWHVDQRLLDRPGNQEIQLALFYDYGSNPGRYPKWQQYLRQHQPPTLIVWGTNDHIFPADGAHPYKRDLKNLEFHLLDTGHFALEEDGDLIAGHIRRFLGQHAGRGTRKVSSK